jgi:alanyl-tRNA synthetase
MLGVRGGFFHRMVAPLVALMGEAYPELAAKQEFVERALKAEEDRFAETLDSGMKIFNEVAQKSGGQIPGEDAFRLYDTYGFPVDLTADIARERGLTVDMAGFESAMEKQRERAREASKFAAAGNLPSDLVAKLAPTQFLGYDAHQADGCRVVALLRDGLPVERIEAGDRAVVFIDRTPFYAESGGQMGDSGVLLGGDVTRFVASDTQKFSAAFHGHVGQLEGGEIRLGDSLSARIDADRRQAIVLNHSATHLLHAALRSVLGEHVTQKGSLVAPDRLRFDFSHFQPISGEELETIERMVNEEIRRNVEAEVHHMGMQEALDFGAMALFGEKYGERVRVLRMGAFSTELCGGTHVGRTGDIGLFKIVSEGGISAGVRRIEAVTGAGALAYVAQEEARLAELGRLTGASAADVVDKVRALIERQRRQDKELETLKAKAAAGATGSLVEQAVEIGGFKVLAARLEGIEPKALRESVDVLKQKLGDAVIVLAAAGDGRAALVAGVSGAARGKVKAGELVAHVAAQIGGKGGGRPDMAQGGGEDGPALLAALQGVAVWVAERAPTDGA